MNLVSFWVFFGCSTLKGSDSAPGGIVSTHQLGSPGASSLWDFWLVAFTRASCSACGANRVVSGCWGYRYAKQKHGELEKLQICLLDLISAVFVMFPTFHVSNSFGHWFLCIYVYIVLHTYKLFFFSEAMVTTYNSNNPTPFCSVLRVWTVLSRIKSAGK